MNLVKRFLILSCTLGLLSAQPAWSNTMLGLSSASNSFYTIDTTTGVATKGVTLTGGAAALNSDIAILNGTVYASSIAYQQKIQFGSIDINTGVFTPILDPGKFGVFAGLAAVPSQNALYTERTQNFTLVKLQVNGSETPIGPASPLLFDYAYDAVHDIAYEATGAALGQFNVNNGVTGIVGSFGLSNANVAQGLGYDNLAGALYLTDSIGNFLRVNTNTGAVTIIGPTGAAGVIDGLADIALPTNVLAPDATGLNVLGLLFGGLLAAQRRRATRLHQSHTYGNTSFPTRSITA